MPKHYIQGYDGDDIWLALTEDEVKQFESEKELPLSRFDNAQYRERKSVVEKQYPQFSTAIPTYSSRGSAQNQVGMSWDKVIGKEVKSADDKDLGEVESIVPDYIEVKGRCIKQETLLHSKISCRRIRWKEASRIINKR